mmetsp:Transcript_55199/g.66457  ORF Transcript_55199/g.66457 Transcript_55199/m.66457 type:complete len:470 (+) Transcript_55199:17-1426(+)|eukprot:CAMPEP_0172500846 /NCGR_PEP_ID=MMETSP1066-20121228/143838_1 /TAXON_ID=671091 /ORGANISM="Coscinodiscus wailesii, Strain CCMP2513" /LENGTH=469 /DNA_ID=CAMNT_0013275323 /DNA_START=14 /DNA_END=1423 /DNA_ORIENTATION=+
MIKLFSVVLVAASLLHDIIHLGRTTSRQLRRKGDDIDSQNHAVDVSERNEEIVLLSAKFAAEVNQVSQMNERIELNPHAELYPDVVSIIHIPDDRLIKITLKPDAQCSHPYLKGRLSGKALTMIKWEKQQQQQRQPNEIFGYYEAPMEGFFFLEIIAVYCNSVPDDASNCLTPGESFRVTANDVEIHVTKPSPAIKGYWTSPVHVPLYTRWKENRDGGTASLVPFDRLTFQTHSKTMNDKFSVLGTTSAGRHRHRMESRHRTQERDECLYTDGGDTTTLPCDLCVVGDTTHSHRAVTFLQELLEGVRIGGVTTSSNPELLLESQIDLFVNRCQTLLIEFSGRDDDSVSAIEVKTLMQNVKYWLESLRHHPRVIGWRNNAGTVLSVPLEVNKTLACPPKDQRNVVYDDVSDEALEGVFVEMGREWIDTRWISEALWDAGDGRDELYYSVEFVQTWFIANHLGFVEGQESY